MEPRVRTCGASYQNLISGRASLLVRNRTDLDRYGSGYYLRCSWRTPGLFIIITSKGRLGRLTGAADCVVKTRDAALRNREPGALLKGPLHCLRRRSRPANRRRVVFDIRFGA